MSLLFTLILSLSPSIHCATDPASNEKVERAKKLKLLIQQEKPKFEARETQRKSLFEELDRLNLSQNRVREKLVQISANQQELSMALENMALEVKRQKEQEQVQKERLLLLFKVVYKVKKDGIFRFFMHGEDLNAITSRIRILYRTLKSHGQLTHQLEERAKRLGESEQKLSRASAAEADLLKELKEQEKILTDLLKKKHSLMVNLNDKQNQFQQLNREYKQISSQVSALFQNLEATRDTPVSFPRPGSLPLPIETGTIVKSFGKSIHEKFHTVTFQKGIEIEAEHNTPVSAVLGGVIEYDGWVKGLGNVVIVHHGGGFYSLSAHLFKSTKGQGTKVDQGETIGYVGDTGNNEHPSLYFEIRENGKAVDPMNYFSSTSLASLKPPTDAIIDSALN